MDKTWVEQKNAEQHQKLNSEIQSLREYLKDKSPLLPSEIETAITEILDMCKFGYLPVSDAAPFWSIVDKRHKYYNDENVYTQFVGELFKSVKGFLGRYKKIISCYHDYDRYLDSEPIEFDGNIIITDPCYIIRAEHHGTEPITKDDWEACNGGSNMEALGINHYMTRDTIYGDWGCTTFNTDTNEVIGEFCADAGLVSVFLLDEVLKYNPDFNYHIERPWTTTLINDFKGTVQFVVKQVKGTYESDSEYWNAGDTWVDYEVEVVGKGINKVTGKPFNFIGTQTGL
jgi:hypothetical protein